MCAHISIEQLDLSPYNRVVQALRPLHSEQGSVQFWREVARLMNDINQNKPQWTWNYMVQVYNQKLKPSARFIRAAMVLEQQIQNSSPLAAASIPFVGFVLAGKVKPGSIILGSSKDCERPGCNTSYVPVVPWQRYCCKACRLKNRNQAGKNETA